MRHRKRGRKFTKSQDKSRLLFRNLSSSFIIKEKIVTTEAKAKGLRSLVEKFITRAKNNTLFNQRFLIKKFANKLVVKKLFDLGLRYKNRSGGYIRIIKINPRKQDSAKMAVVELIK